MTRLINTSALWRLIIPRDRKETAAEKVRGLIAATTTEGKQK